MYWLRARDVGFVTEPDLNDVLRLDMSYTKRLWIRLPGKMIYSVVPESTIICYNLVLVNFSKVHVLITFKVLYYIGMLLIYI